MVLNIIPYISFNGDALEAINFYEEVFETKAEVTYYGEWSEEFAGEVPEEIKDKVMHGQISTSDFTLYFSDHIDKEVPYDMGTAISLGVSVATGEEAESIYKKLSKGGRDIVPFESTTFSSGYAQFVDKFGLIWQVIADIPVENE